jgi:hypothetical protein
VAFTSAIIFTLLKTDGLAAQGSRGGLIYSLLPTDGPIEHRTCRINITDVTGDGKLTVHTTLSKYPLL